MKEEKILYLVGIASNYESYDDIKNYVCSNKKNAIKIIEKNYYLDLMKGKKDRWSNKDGSVKGFLTELFLR